ncbi:hypothetical protein N7457_001192 [Penicillium paradoxum]|uniref:uncharacterized protein n=1 Tax=Penicillium paradoxum TaxID=176176 RepID=UPI002548E9E5|nr:uncharacterized protein N7457_001192 [Penicillium paradoxum]KAJ5794593.1 hypothetical protein N7457_001192 [Penicillium paradoxum]
MSTRSIRKPRRQAPENAMPDAATQHAAAAAAASRAMRCIQSSSRESRSSYDRLGGPGSFAVPRRRPGASLQSTRDSISVCHSDFSEASMPRQSKKTTSESTQTHFLNDPAALPPITELRGLDGRDSSVPSSYRRLRKAKSMFTTRQRTAQTPYGVPTLPCGDPLDPERSPGFQMPRTMRRSMSFLRGGYQPTQAGPNAQNHDAAIQLARSQFAQDPDGTGIRTRRSSFLLGRKKDHRPFHKTFRATSEGAADASFLAGDHPGSSRKSRSFSNSIKNRFRRVFGFSKIAVQQPPLPSVSNFPRKVISTPNKNSMEEYLPHEDMPTEDGVASDYFRAISESPSRNSLCSSKSRVTSWADSSMANTVTTRKLGHRQSLSLIREDGDLDQHMPRTPVMSETETQGPSSLKPSPCRMGIVDSQDLYTALMRQIGQTSLPDSREDFVFGTVPEHRVIPERMNSVHSQCGRRTIRRVPSEQSSVSHGSFTTARGGDQSSPQRYHSRSVRSMQVSRGPPTQPANQQPAVISDKMSPRSLYAMGDGSDDDSGSVVIAHLRDPNRDVVSPSIYSRTTSGNSPTRVSKPDIDLRDEPGTAIIFTPQRGIYTSPKRAALVPSSMARPNPSADWQEWMSSQIERIEQASPTREHIREDAQFQDDDEYLTNIARQAPITVCAPATANLLNASEKEEDTKRRASEENRVPSQNNFSRPFNQTSNMQVIMRPHRTEPMNAAQKYSNSSIMEPATDSGENASPKSIIIAHTRKLSPIRLRSGNMQPPESPTPKRVGTKSSWTQEQQRRYSARRAPIAQDGRANQFRSMRSQRDNCANNENAKQQDDFNGMMENYHQVQDIHSTISSKRMVDLFLDSRRRRRGASTDNSAPTEAFI